MRIAIISKSNADGGGASRVAEDLACMLNKHPNVIAHHWLGYPGKNWHPHMRHLFVNRFFQLVHGAFRKFSRVIGYPDFFTPELFFFLLQKGLDYDLYHFHDTSGTVSPLAIRWFAKRKPVVWTFHDCSPFTGGCLYPMTCTAFHTRCQNCPQLKPWPLMTQIDRTGRMQDFRRNTAKSVPFVAVTPSHWMADEAMKSEMFRNRPFVIPNSIDGQIFKCQNRQALREELKLPQNIFLILISASYLDDLRKGTALALEAIKSCQRNVALIVIGKNSALVETSLKGYARVYSTGYLHDDQTLAKYYGSADVYLFPSLADNFPTSILETMSVGTPSITFRTGGIPEMLEHRVSGWLAEPGDVQGLVEGLQYSIDHPEERLCWAKNAYEKSKTFSPELFLERHLSLYRQICSGTPIPEIMLNLP